MRNFLSSIFKFIKRNSSKIENLFWNFITGMIDIRLAEIRSN